MKDPNELHAGTCVSWMERPNLLVPLEADDANPQAFFPLLQLKYVEAGEEDDETRPLFFDPCHGEGWEQWADRAPTWMDPHKFAEMALQHKRLKSCLAYCFKNNTEKPAIRDMPEMLDEVMEDYLVYLLEMFEIAKPLLVQWLVRNYCYQQTDPAKTEKKRTPRKRKRPVE